MSSWKGGLEDEPLTQRPRTVAGSGRTDTCIHAFDFFVPAFNEWWDRSDLILLGMSLAVENRVYHQHPAGGMCENHVFVEAFACTEVLPEKSRLMVGACTMIFAQIVSDLDATLAGKR